MHVELQREIVRPGHPFDRIVPGISIQYKEEEFVRWQIYRGFCEWIPPSIEYACEWRKFRELSHMYKNSPRCGHFGTALLQNELFDLAEAWLVSTKPYDEPYVCCDVDLIVKYNRNKFIMEQMDHDEEMLYYAVKYNNVVIFKWTLENRSENFIYGFLEHILGDDDTAIEEKSFSPLFDAFNMGLADYLTNDEAKELIDHVKSYGIVSYDAVIVALKHFPELCTPKRVTNCYREVIDPLRVLIDELPDYADMTLRELCEI